MMTNFSNPTKPTAKPTETVWRGPNGEVIACVEKLKVMRENLDEIRRTCQDALDDAVLMGCDETQVREAFIQLIVELHSDYSPLK